jgi:hypothetical protein
MTDIMAFVPCGVIAVEAKALETFDKVVAEWIVADERKDPTSPPRRRGIIDRYAGAFGVCSSALMECRYQLLHRTLAAALTARDAGASRAWRIVQSFAPSDAKEHHRNRADFDRFTNLVGIRPRLAGYTVTLGWGRE